MKWKVIVFFALAFTLSFGYYYKNSNSRSIASEKQKNSTYGKELVLGNILKNVLENMHLTKKKMNDDLSKKAFELYLERIDYSKQFLLIEDVKMLRQYESLMDDELFSGKLTLVEETKNILNKRISEIRKWVFAILEKKVNFNSDKEIETDPEKRKFLKNSKELKERWDKIITYDIISQYLTLKDEQEGKHLSKKQKKKLAKEKNSKNKKKEILTDIQLEEKARKKVRDRYKKVFKRITEERQIDYLDKFYNSITKVYDPHTHYFIPEEKEDFEIDMTGKLEGIGALLREEGSYIKVEKIIPGSASWKGKELQAEDLILAVAQGDEDPVDVVDMSLRDAVKLIRGPKGTTVKLTVKKPSGNTEIIAIVRDEVIIEESYAKSVVLDDKKLGVKVGIIVVPKFYRDFHNKDGRNCSTDVRIEIEKLKKKDVHGIILDLRNNGGGALEDARLMGGLFIDEGPIVQTKGSASEGIDILSDTDGKTYWDGKLIVLVNRFSASASEIVAGAMQDYGRALIVGTSEQTHGKGTVQAVIDLDGYLSPIAKMYSPLGAAKVTIQKFFRVNGESTQFEGVKPDILLPDAFSYVDSGEKSLDYAIPHSTITPAKYKRVKLKKNFDIKKLAKLSGKRVKKSKKFKKILDSITWYKKRKDESMRKIDLKDMIAFRNSTYNKADEFEITQINKDIHVIATDKQNTEVKKELFEEFKESLQKDPVIEETLNIFKDWK